MYLSLQRGFEGILRTGLTVLGAAIVGFAIPAAWMRLGAEVQGLSANGAFSMMAFGAVFIGIIGSYFAIIWLASYVAARRGRAAGPPRRQNWNRSMRDERHQAPKLNPLETVFVTTTILVGGAYMIWLLFFATVTFPSA